MKVHYLTFVTGLLLEIMLFAITGTLLMLKWQYLDMWKVGYLLIVVAFLKCIVVSAIVIAKRYYWDKI